MPAFHYGGWVVPRVVFASLAIALAAAPVAPDVLGRDGSLGRRQAPSEVRELQEPEFGRLGAR